LIRRAYCLRMAEFLLDIGLQRLDDLLRADAVGVDRTGDVTHHCLDLHPIGLRQELENLLTLGAVLVGQDALFGAFSYWRSCTGRTQAVSRLKRDPSLIYRPSVSTARISVWPSAHSNAWVSMSAANNSCRRAKSCSSRTDYSKLSMAAIARSAGISKPLLYHYFPSKQAYFQATFQNYARTSCAAGSSPIHSRYALIEMPGARLAAAATGSGSIRPRSSSA